MKRTFLIALNFILCTTIYGQFVDEAVNRTTNLSKDECWKEINKWAIDGFYRYKAEIIHEDKVSGRIVLRGRYIAEMEGLISFTYQMNVPLIDFLINIKCGEKSCEIVFEDLYWSCTTGPVSAFDITSVAVLEQSTKELKVVNNAGGRFIYNDGLKNRVVKLMQMLSDAESKAEDATLKRKERKDNQRLVDSYTTEFLVYAKAFNDMETLSNQILREISVYLD